MRGELDGDAHDRLRGDNSDLSSRASLQFYDDHDDAERLDNSFNRHSKLKDQMQNSQKSSFASSQFTSPRHQSKKDSTETNQDLRLPLRAPSQQETFRSPRSKITVLEVDCRCVVQRPSKRMLDSKNNFSHNCHIGSVTLGFPGKLCQHQQPSPHPC